MGGHCLPVISCTACRKPIDLTVDLCADEYGQAIHDACYITRTLVTRWQGVSTTEAAFQTGRNPSPYRTSAVVDRQTAYAPRGDAPSETVIPYADDLE